jgi:hypothetical protein
MQPLPSVQKPNTFGGRLLYVCTVFLCTVFAGKNERSWPVIWQSGRSYAGNAVATCTAMRDLTND